MGWIPPRTWGAEPINISKLNTEVRDNSIAIKAPPTGYYVGDSSDAYTITLTSTSWATINSEITVSLTTSGGDILVSFIGGCSTMNSTLYLDFEFNGVRIGGADGIIAITDTTGITTHCFSFYWLLTDIPAGTHTMLLKYKLSSGSTNAVFFLGGTGGIDSGVPPELWAREIS